MRISLNITLRIDLKNLGFLRLKWCIPEINQKQILIGGDARAFPNINMPYPPALDLLPGTVLDQHVLKRNRQFDLIPVLDSYPHLLGIAMDEQTAIIVSNNQFSVWGPSYVLVYDPLDWALQVKKFGKIYKPFIMLSKGQKFDLMARNIVK